jgi:hypothetical protein
VVSSIWRGIVLTSNSLQPLLASMMVELYFLSRNMATNHKFVVKASHLLRSISILDKVTRVEYLVLVNVLS